MSQESKQTNKLTVTIYGIDYTLRSSHEDQTVEKIVGYLNEQMEKIAQAQPNLSYKDVAVLAACNICEEYFNIKEEYEQLLEIINDN